MGWVEEVRERQVKRAGSEALYRRLNERFDNLEIEPLFMFRQMLLFKLRREILTDLLTYRIHYNSDAELTLLSTQKFDQVLQEIESSGQIRMSPFEIGKERKREAHMKFFASNQIVSLLRRLHPDTFEGTCLCDQCNVKLKHLKLAIRRYPEAVKLAEQNHLDIVFTFYCPRSLKEMCMRQVLQEGLEQDCLSNMGSKYHHILII